MKVLQLIDSLDAGGAEQIAVHLANQFPKIGIQSYLCTTRAEGILKEQVHEEVNFLFLQKKRTLDLDAISRLKAFIKKNDIEFIHAHTTSFFFATLLKISYPKIKLVWHTHLGARAEKVIRSNRYIKFCSYFFDAIITVNDDLKQWCLDHLKTKRVYYVPNGVSLLPKNSLSEKREKVILCVANLKEPKNHSMLLEAFALVNKQHPDWNLYLIGKTFHDAYETKVRNSISENALEDVVSIFGQQKDIPSFLKKGSIGVLSSTHEGLPMALLEYGAAGLAVITTAVGECVSVIGDDGIVVPSNNPSKFAEALLVYLNDTAILRSKAEAFHDKIETTYTIVNMASSIRTIYKSIPS
jgi:glycosyltransferase involved in cell wall biosynthesis